MNADPGTSGTPGSGQGRIYYVLSAAAAGNQTLTYTITTNQQMQVAWIDFAPSTGCQFSHDVDSPLGAANPVTDPITIPSYSPPAGDVLFNFTITSTHMVDPVGSPWTALTWPGSLSHFLNESVDLVAYNISAPGGTVANNSNTLHSGLDSVQALLTSFSMSSAPANACPSGVPVSTCFFIASNGVDTNTGADEQHPWAHAPGMPNCASSCAAVTPSSGKGFIFRGGDTWHFGNSGLTPYTGGTWDVSPWWGTAATCLYDGTKAGCIYYGVDQTWFSGASWSRPILDGDNPIPSSTDGTGGIVASCPHQIGTSNNMAVAAPQSIFDNFELRGLCNNTATHSSGNDNTMLGYHGTGNAGAGMVIEENLYLHGWTSTITSAGALVCTIMGGSPGGLNAIDHVVIDGADSASGNCEWGVFPSFYHFRDSMVRYTTQGVGQYCHDIHDNIFEHFVDPFNVFPSVTHGNTLECNADDPGNPNASLFPGTLPQNTPNVVYNNIVRHDNANYDVGNPRFYFSPTGMNEFWFNNIQYDLTTGAQQNWDIDDSNAGADVGSWNMFNNTIVDAIQPCASGGHFSSAGPAHLFLSNEHLINTPIFTGGAALCNGSTSSTNVQMSDATATSQGYTTGTGGTGGGTNTCASDTTTPCTPTASGNSTVGAGTNQQTLCSQLATFTGEPSISTEAFNACKFGTTDGCTYNTSTHAMVCPAQTARARPTSANWDSGAYQFSSSALFNLNVSNGGVGLGTVTSNDAQINCGVTCSAVYTSGSVTLTASNISGAVFTGWTVDGSGTTCPGTGTCTLTMTANHSVTANFVFSPHAPATPSFSFQ